MGWFFNGECRSTKMLPGCIAIITGSNTGIGKYTAMDFARRGAEVIMACRNMEKAKAAEEEIRSNVPEAKLKIMHLDLSSLSSVRSFCTEFSSNYNKLHYLINNAGVMMCPRSLTEDGFELQFGTNHLGHFLLTLLLLPLILESGPARIVNVSSLAHWFCFSLRFDDLNYEKSYSSLGAYARSKLANILFTKELARRLKDTEVKSASLHPGVVNTELTRHFSKTVFPGVSWICRNLGFLVMKTVKQGAQTTLLCALDDNVESGLYYDDCAVARTSRYAKDPNLATELWDKSLELVGLKGYDPFLKICKTNEQP